METYRGVEFHFLGFDEISMFPKDWVAEMRTCVRTTNPRIKLKIRSTSNPVGVGAVWVWDKYCYAMPEMEVHYFYTDDDGVEVETTSNDERATSRMWIKSVRDENVLLKNKARYESEIRALGGRRAKAYLTGELVIEDSPDQLIPWESINYALDRKKVEPTGRYWLAADISNKGNDKFVIMFGRGNQVLELKVFEGRQDTNTCVEEIAKYLRHYKLQISAVIDNQGNPGVFDVLCKKFPKNEIIGVAAKDPGFDARKAKKYSSENKFDTFRSELFWNLRCDFESRAFSLANIRDSKWKDLLKTEIASLTFDDDDSVIKVIRKKELKKSVNLGHSPDLVDCLCYMRYLVMVSSAGHITEREFDPFKDRGFDFPNPGKVYGKDVDDLNMI